MPELDERKRIIDYDTVNDPDENYYVLADNGTEGTGKVNVKKIGPGNMISDAYSDQDTYAVGDVCIHNNILYVCNTEIDTPHAFDLSEWDPDTLGNYCSNLNGDVSEIKSSLSDYFSKEFEATASTERDFILNVMVQAYTYVTNNSLPFIFCKVSWTNNNSGYAILSSNRRFQIQIGDSMSLGVLNSAGTALANLRSVTTTAHP